MPRYDVIDNETGVIEEVSMMIAEFEQYLKDNPNKKQYFSNGIPTLDSVRLGIKKTDDTWREVLSKVKERSARSNLDVNER